MTETLQHTLDKINEHLGYPYSDSIKKLLREVRDKLQAEIDQQIIKPII